MTFANHIFAGPLMNASSVHRMTTQELDKLTHSEAGTFIAKSYTVNE